MASERNKYAWIIWIIFGVFILFILYILFFPGKIGVIDGSRTGIVTSVDYKSDITWSSDDIIQFKSDIEPSQEDKYCINSLNVKNALIELSKNKKRIRIYYKNDFILWKWQCNGGYSIIWQVEIL